jgi:hypothetical protein
LQFDVGHLGLVRCSPKRIRSVREFVSLTSSVVAATTAGIKLWPKLAPKLAAVGNAIRIGED